MAQDFDEIRPDVAETSERTLRDVRKMDAPTARSVHADLEETDLSGGIELPGAIVPQADDEFVRGNASP